MMSRSARRASRLEPSPDETSPPAINRATTLRLLRLARPYTGRLILAAICMVVSTVSFLAIPYAFRLVTDSVFVHHSAAQLNEVVLLLLAIVVATAVFGYGRGYLLSYTGGRIVADLRVSLYRHLLQQPLVFYDERRSGGIITC